MIVLADDPSHSWRPAEQPHADRWFSNDHAIRAGDDLTLTYNFTGAPVVYTDYPDAAVYPTATAVVVAPRAVERPGTQARRQYAEGRNVTVRLDQPLGGRVLLDANGLAVAVTS